ncbi:hypothetical protein Poly59_27080 [Rubripirellula reticaptiva]|uniref:Keratin-like protein n=1 Tax=Rubripirellula reticaptiva TaxID=2528013 RepID=A0A5C6EUI7_9BACT|nr:hypothetical protein Poly59_27080 [Rubripirellula reticaptiva]
MRRAFVPALLAVALVACSSVNASAFGLFDKLCGNSCDSCCDVEPACGCEIAAPACGCEVLDPCCDTGCAPKMGLLKKLFSKHNGCGCDSGCAVEPACGCEVAAPCGCAAPTCGCEIVDPCCDSRPACGTKIKSLFSRIFHRSSSCCDSGCSIEPACGCEIAAPCGCSAEPACGAEPSCGCGF